MKGLQQFASVHLNVRIPSNFECHSVDSLTLLKPNEPWRDENCRAAPWAMFATFGMSQAGRRTLRGRNLSPYRF
jgi:hypothetical protein